MRRLFFVPVCLVGLACQSSQYVTRDELRTLIALPTAQDSEGKIQKCDLDALVAGAFTAPEASTRAASVLASADQRLSPLTSALSAIDKAFEVCANNLANAETTAFKRTIAGRDPAGTPIFSVDFEQGSMENTGRQLDAGIQGQGFFKVKTMNGYAYTRNGNFFVNKDGEIVLGMGDGYKLQPAIAIPKGTTNVSISTDGKMSVTQADVLAPTVVGQLELHQFRNESALKLLGGSLYTQTESSGPPTASKPGDKGAGQILQGFLEGSNVDPMKERLRMRFLQNWRATIVRSINESQSDKAEPANAEVSSNRASRPNEEPVAANTPRLAALNTALRVIELEYAVRANNLANAKTTAFKGSRVNLENMESQTVKPPGTMTTMGDVSPTGISYGAGVKVSSTQLNTEQGPMENTGRQLDMAIQGPAFFKVKIFPDVADGTGYTRNGNFFVNKDGDLVLGAGDGYKLDPKINIPKGITNISISSDGKVSVTKAGTLAPLTVGQIELYQFINEQGLNLLGSGVYTQTESSGPPSQSKPGEVGAGQLLQGFLEASNVKPEDERMRMRFLDQWRAMILSIINDSK